MPPGEVIGTCFHCKRPCTDEDYCFGCKTIVCADCNPYYNGPDRSDHRPEDHLLCFPMLTEGVAYSCRRVVGDCATDHPTLCGRPAAHSAYCLECLHAVIDERARRESPS